MCNHGWFPPVGYACPECLWEESLRDQGVPEKKNAARQKIAHNAVIAAAKLVPQEYAQEIADIAANDNRWKAIKTAKQYREQGFRALW